jgi:hypothetical protein
MAFIKLLSPNTPYHSTRRGFLTRLSAAPTADSESIVGGVAWSFFNCAGTRIPSISVFTLAASCHTTTRVDFAGKMTSPLSVASISNSLI